MGFFGRRARRLRVGCFGPRAGVRARLRGLSNGTGRFSPAGLRAGGRRMGAEMRRA